jgi:hypothetical protein
MPTKVEKLEAELKLEKLEQKFVEAKAAGKVTDKMKHEVRAARQDFRDNYRSPAAAGASPKTVSGKVSA